MKTDLEPSFPNGTLPLRPLDRRTFLAAAVTGGVALATSGLSRLSALEPIRIGYVVPPSGRSVALGASLARGMEQAAVDADAPRALQVVTTRLFRQEALGEDATRRAAEVLVDAGVDALVGGVDAPATAAMESVAERAGIPLIAISGGGRGGASCGRSTFHVAPAEATNAAAVIHALSRKRGFRRWVLIGGGTEQDFDRAETIIRGEAGTVVATLAGMDPDGPGPIHALADQAKADAIILLDTPRPGWLSAYAAAGGSIPLVLLGRNSSLLLAGASGEGPPAEGAGQDASLDAVPLFWADLWHAALPNQGAARLNARFAENFGAPMDPVAWLGWMAVTILTEAAIRSGSNGREGLLRQLRADGASFDGHKGSALTFGADRTLRQPLYLLQRAAGSTVLIGEAPSIEAGESFEAAFDRLSERSTGCPSL